MRHHAIEIIEHIAGCNPESVKTGVSRRCVSPEIALRTVAHRMGLTVDFDREPALQACKVDDVALTWKLAAKAEPSWALTQMLPHYDLRKRHLAAKLASKPHVVGRGTDGSMMDAFGFGPSTMLRMVPLPVPGRI